MHGQRHWLPYPRDPQRGPRGAAGTPGTSAATDFAEFFALMGPDNSAPIALGAAVQFPQTGPAQSGTGITRLSASTFQLATPGIYEVTWQVSIAEAGQLQLKLNAGALPNTCVSRATGTSQIFGSTFIDTTGLPNAVLSVINPAGNAGALTLPPDAGGPTGSPHSPVSATLVIRRLQ